MEAGRQVMKAVPVVQTPDVDSLGWVGVMEMKRSDSGFDWEAESMGLLLCVCVCGKLFPKMVVATSFILFAPALIKRQALFPLLWAGSKTSFY